jgi:ferric-dicitrate binding protein FerR (iron transport regulator)
MESYTDYKRIAELISREIDSKLTEEEKEELSNWLNENTGNREAFDRIKSLDNYIQWIRIKKEANIQEGWKTLYSAIQKEKKRFILQKMLKYAAAVLLPLLIAGGIYYFTIPKEKSVIAYHTTEIKPGTSKAILILNNGKPVILDSNDELSLKETDGSTIKKDKGLLTYVQPVQKQAKVPLFNTIRIPQGAEYNLILADGTRVFLNSMSEFRYPVQFYGDLREVELTGEAYFEVSHSKVPFIVKTAGVHVEVLGTSFNINAYENSGKVITTLVEGSVKIDTKDQAGSCILLPEEQAVFSQTEHQLAVNKVDVSLYTAWKDGKFIFYDTHLEDVMNILTRWYSAEVHFADPVVKELLFSGSIDRYGDIRQILEIIQSTNTVEIEINKTVILFKKKN